MKPPTCSGTPASKGKWLAILLACLALACLPPASSRAGELLRATFDDKPIDQPIGVGGAGQPAWMDEDFVDAIVRNEPFATSCLEISNTTAQGAVGFRTNNLISEGVVAIITDLWFHEDSDCYARFMILSDLGQMILCLDFTGDGDLAIIEPLDELADLPDVSGRPLPVLIALNLDSQTYSVWVEGVQWAVDRPMYEHMNAFSQVVIRVGYNCPEGNRFSIDQIRILDEVPPVPVEPTTWGRVRALFR